MPLLKRDQINNICYTIGVSTDAGLASRAVPINFRHIKSQCQPIMLYNWCQYSKLIFLIIFNS